MDGRETLPIDLLGGHDARHCLRHDAATMAAVHLASGVGLRHEIRAQRKAIMDVAPENPPVAWMPGEHDVPWKRGTRDDGGRMKDENDESKGSGLLDEPTEESAP